VNAVLKKSNARPGANTSTIGIGESVNNVAAAASASISGVRATVKNVDRSRIRQQIGEREGKGHRKDNLSCPDIAHRQIRK